ncbi:hypothetical protein DCAR_0313191 [Daucus carota subsp. sativus]|uniref:Uncharacterized protein n=1 Tax=Daucus carota subsp. sativus TaxID=79200 RepID=A0A161WW29_DAUCS|nr:hypothetical protein DCAR_0313191 [Daucus carota subsp. sativus]
MLFISTGTCAAITAGSTSFDDFNGSSSGVVPPADFGSQLNASDECEAVDSAFIQEEHYIVSIPQLANIYIKPLSDTAATESYFKIDYPPLKDLKKTLSHTSGKIRVELQPPIRVHFQVRCLAIKQKYLTERDGYITAARYVPKLYRPLKEDIHALLATMPPLQ